MNVGLDRRAMGRIALTLFLLSVVGFMLLESLWLGPVARYVPARVLILTLGLLVFQLSRDIKGGRQFPSRAAPAGERDAPGDLGRREAEAIWWVAFLLALGYVAGVSVAGFLFPLLYSRRRAQVSWTTAGCVGFAVWVAIEGGLAGVLGATLHEGAIWGWFGLD